MIGKTQDGISYEVKWLDRGKLSVSFGWRVKELSKLQFPDSEQLQGLFATLCSVGKRLVAEQLLESRISNKVRTYHRNGAQQLKAARVKDIIALVRLADSKDGVPAQAAESNFTDWDFWGSATLLNSATVGFYFHVKSKHIGQVGDSALVSEIVGRLYTLAVDQVVEKFLLPDITRKVEEIGSEMARGERFARIQDIIKTIRWPILI